MYSFFGNCKKNEIDPLEWLTIVLSRIPNHSIQRLEEILPQNLL
ncbi:MAG: transposase domain-containing protein [Bacteroidetes bacterium]|nr:transposase domain-containing protein [Bacteroidota bacterium]